MHECRTSFESRSLLISRQETDAEASSCIVALTPGRGPPDCLRTPGDNIPARKKPPLRSGGFVS